MFPVNVLGVSFDKDVFEFTMNETASEYRVGDTVEITAALKSHAIHASILSDTYCMISIVSYKKGTENPGITIPALAQSTYIFPKQKLSASEILSFDEPGEYIVAAKASFSINDSSYRYEKEVELKITE